MNIYLHELRTRLSSVLIWSASIAGLIILFLAFFPAFAADAALIADMMDAFPKELLIAFGMTDMDWSTVLGFFALVFTFAQICLAIQAANYGIGLVSIEETEWTADFLLSKPISRLGILGAKLGAALTALALTQAVVWAAAFIFTDLFKQGQQVDSRALAALLLSMTVFQLFFLTVGIALSLLVRRLRSVLPVSMGLVFGLYVLNAFGAMIGERSLEVISPFTHFAPNAIIRTGGWDWSLVPVSLGAIVIASIAAVVLYTRRDIASAV